jgi:hypothetical protein
VAGREYEYCAVHCRQRRKDLDPLQRNWIQHTPRQQRQAEPEEQLLMERAGE